MYSTLEEASATPCRWHTCNRWFKGPFPDLFCTNSTRETTIFVPLSAWKGLLGRMQSVQSPLGETTHRSKGYLISRIILTGLFSRGKEFLPTFFFFTPDKLPKLRQPHASKNWIGEVNTNTLDLLHMIYFNLTTFTTVNFTTVLLLTNASYSVAIRRGGKQVKIQSQL